MIALAKVPLSPSPDRLTFLIDEIQVMATDVIIAINDKECTQQDEKRKVFIFHIYIIQCHCLDKCQVAILDNQRSEFLSQNLLVQFFAAAFREKFIKLIKQFSGCEFIHIRRDISLIMLECLHHLHRDAIAESFNPILTNIFLIDKFLSFVGISEQCQDSAIQEFRQIRKPDMGIITPVGKEGHDNTCSLGDTQFIRNKTKIRICFLIKLFSERRPFCLFYDNFEGLEQVYRLHIFFI